MTTSVLLVGGPPASGKTTLARRLARKYGFRLYNSDTRTWEHRDRALALDSIAAKRWEALAPSERWGDDISTSDLLAMSLHHDRGSMVIDDIIEMGDGPLVVAEGTPVAPAAIADSPLAGAPMVWLLPTPDFHDSQLNGSSCGGELRLYRELRTVIAREAKCHNVPTIDVDSSTSPSEVMEQLESMMGDAIAAGPRAATVNERRALLRAANMDTVNQVRSFSRRPWADLDPETVPRSFVCECGLTDCDRNPETTVAEAAAGPVLASGHRIG